MKLKISDVAALNATLKNSTMAKGDLSAKLALVEAIIATKPVADEYGNLVNVTREKLQPEDFSQMQQRAQKPDLTQSEILEINRYFIAYEKSVETALSDEAAKEVEVTLKPWTEEQFSALLESNNAYTGAQMILLHTTLMPPRQ